MFNTGVSLSDIKTYGFKGSFSQTIDIDVIKRYNNELLNTKNSITAYYRAMSDGNGNVIQCNKATRDLIASQNGAMVSTEALKEAQDAASKSGSKFAGVMKTLKGALINFGIMLAIEGIIALAKFTQKTFFPTVKQLKEELSETTQEIADLHSEQESLNSELETTSQRIAELKAQGTLTFTEEAELTRLQKENAELERKLELTKANKAASESEFQGDFLNAFNSDYGDKATFNYTGRRDFWDKLADALLEGSETRFTAEEYTDDLFANYEKALSGDKAYEHNLDKYKERINDVYEDYQEYLKQLEDADYSYGTNEQIDAYIDQIEEFNDRYLVAFGNSENLFSQIVNRDKFSEAYAAIKDLGDISQESLSKLYNENDKVKELINYLLTLGQVDWQSILGDKRFGELDEDGDGVLTKLELFDEKTGECKVTSEQFSQAISGVANELNKVEDAAESTAGNVQKFSDVFKSIKEGTSVLADAYSDIEDGGEISLEHLMSLLDKYPDLVEYVNLENGQHNITIGILKAKFEAEKKAQLAKIAASKAAVNAEIAEQKAILDTITTKKEKAKQNMAETMVSIGQFKTVGDALNAINARPGYYLRGFDWDVSDAKVAIADAEKQLKTLNAQETLIKKISWDDIVSGSGSSKSGSATIEAAEDEIAYWKHQHEIGLISEATYYKKLEAIRQKYYAGNKDYLDRDRQLQEEYHDWEVKNAEDGFEKKIESLQEKYVNGKLTYSQLKSEITKLINSTFKNDKDTQNEYLAKVGDYLSEAVDDKTSKNEDSFEDEVAKIQEKYANGEYSLKGTENRIKNLIKEMFGDDKEKQEELIGKVSDYLEEAEEQKDKKNREDFDSSYDKLKYQLENGFISEKKYYQDLDKLYKKHYGDKTKYLDEYSQYSQEVYDGFKDMYKEDLEADKKALEEKKEAITDYYDELIEKIKESQDEEDYEKEQSEKRKEIFDLDMQIAELMRDGSEKAKARIAELEEERLQAEEDLVDFETDKAREDEIERLEKEKEAREKEVQDKIDNIDATLDNLDTNTKDIRDTVIQYAKAKGVDIKFAYASGTRSSVGGFGRINEKGIEMISAPDGNGSYVNLMPSSYVFSAKATEFLWKLATEHSLPQAMYNSIAKSIQTQSSTPSVNVAQPITITMGDIIIQGNADKQTVADIKKQQENTVRMVLQKIKELQK